MSGRVWNAKWIGYAYDPREDIGVFAFRRRLDLDRVPEELLVNVSADQRYRLYVNGDQVIFGPQRGDPNHWFFETVDLAPFLVKGTNWIVAVVWNFGWMAPMAQMSAGRTAFVLESISEHTANRQPPTANTPDGWEVRRIPGWGFDMMHRGVGEFYIDVGPGEIIDAGEIPWGFLGGEDPPESEIQNPKSKIPAWSVPHVICQAEERGAGGGGTPWMLVPRSIPPMDYRLREKSPTFRTDFDPSAEPGERRMPAGEQTAPVLEGRWEVPKAPSPSPDGEGVGGGERTPNVNRPAPNTFTVALDLSLGSPILLDYSELICAYPRLTLSGPPGTVVTVTYDEALWNPDGTKGNRNEVEGKHARGYQDKFILDGAMRTFEPLWWRTWRYLVIEAEHPVSIHSIDAYETGYPLAEESSFEADDPLVKPIWNVSVRTAKRCAGETYFDCPYYEQLQYIGDTRIQALIGYYLGRDRALQRNAVETLGWSLMENGLTQSRYPSRQTQIIPPFSLWWVMMLYDQMLYDEANAKPNFASFQSLSRVLGRCRALAKQEGQFWQFGDWVPGWRWGVPPGGALAAVHQLTLDWAQFATLSLKQHWEGKLPTPVDPKFWRDYPYFGMSPLVASSKSAIDCTPSEHAEALVRLLSLDHRQNWDPWPNEALIDANAARCTYYFSYYKHLAMFGSPQQPTTNNQQPFDYLQELQPWKEMIEDGLTTFAENPEPTRSDCHAWSAHPILGYFQIIAGVTSIAPGWKKARIMPHPGSLRRFDARIAHPDGELRVAYEDGKLEIDTPVKAELNWRGTTKVLETGKHSF